MYEIVRDRGKIVKYIHPSIEDYFLSKVKKTDTCWIWQGSPNKSGYGDCNYKNRKDKAHRVAYRLYKGEIPNGLLVRHTCDNRMCVNPEHLVVGTHKDNAQDREKKGRNGVSRGSNSRLSLLTEDEVLIIRWLREQGVSLGNIGKLYHVDKTTVWGIINRRSWKHI